jgi:hypothetical protein
MRIREQFSETDADVRRFEVEVDGDAQAFMENGVLSIEVSA